MQCFYRLCCGEQTDLARVLTPPFSTDLGLDGDTARRITGDRSWRVSYRSMCKWAADEGKERSDSYLMRIVSKLFWAVL